MPGSAGRLTTPLSVPAVPALVGWLGCGATWERVGIVVRVLAPLTALVVGGPSTFLGVLAVQELGLWLARRATEERLFAERLFLAAFGLRALLAVSLYLYARPGTGNGALLQDDYANDVVAQWLVRIARGEGMSLFTGQKQVLENAYPLAVAGIYALFGYAPLIPRVANAALGALLAVLMFEIARPPYGSTVARLAGISSALLPSLVFWSTLTLKEIPVLFALVLALYALQRLIAERPRASTPGNAVVLLAAASAILVDLRLAAFLLVLAAAVPVLGIRLARRGRGRSLALVAALLAVAAAGVLAVASLRGVDAWQAVESRIGNVVREVRHRRAWEAFSARSQIDAQVDVVALDAPDLPVPEDVAARDAEPFSLTADLLEPLAFGLLAPAPWQVRSTRDLVASAEMGIWYVFILATAVGLAAPVRDRQTPALLLLYGLATWLLLAFSEGNLGNLVRHRIMLAPALLVLGSPGLVHAWRRIVAARAHRVGSGLEGASAGGARVLNHLEQQARSH